MDTLTHRTKVPIFSILYYIWLQQVFNNNNQRLQTAVVEETVVEDATVKEQVAQELIIKGRDITHIAAGPYNGFLQGSFVKV